MSRFIPINVRKAPVRRPAPLPVKHKPLPPARRPLRHR